MPSWGSIQIPNQASVGSSRLSALTRIDRFNQNQRRNQCPQCAHVHRSNIFSGRAGLRHGHQCKKIRISLWIDIHGNGKPPNSHWRSGKNAFGKIVQHFVHRKIRHRCNSGGSHAIGQKRWMSQENASQTAPADNITNTDCAGSARFEKFRKTIVSLSCPGFTINNQIEGKSFFFFNHTDEKFFFMCVIIKGFCIHLHSLRECRRSRRKNRKNCCHQDSQGQPHILNPITPSRPAKMARMAKKNGVIASLNFYLAFIQRFSRDLMQQPANWHLKKSIIL